jgi:hypothetical protein
MSEILTDVTSKAIDLSAQPGFIEATIPSFSRPVFLVGSAAVITAGVVAEIMVRRNEKRIQKTAVPFADPEIAQQVKLNGRRTRIAERLAWYTALAATTLGFAHVAEPHTDKSEFRGSGSVLIGAGYSADAKDMENGDERATRFQAAINGALAAAEKNEVPFSITLTGSTVRNVDELPAQDKDIERARERIQANLDPEFRNGKGEMGTAVRQSLASSIPDRVNNIIMVASNLQDEEVTQIKGLQRQMKKDYPESRLKAVVVGQGEGKYRVGADILTTPTSTGEFEDLLGVGSVHPAKSADEVESAINDIINETQVVEKKQPFGLFRDGFTVSALVLIGLAGFRRNWGRLKFRGQGE